MPTIACTDCNHQVSTSAASCPSCGRPMAATTPSHDVSKGVRDAATRSSIANLVVFAGLAAAFAVGVTTSAALGWTVLGISLAIAAAVYFD